MNVEYWVSLELGTWQYIEVQNDTAEEIHQENSFWILFDEKASLTSDYCLDSPPELPKSDVKETRNKNLERQKNANSEIVMNADKARTNQNKK